MRKGPVLGTGIGLLVLFLVLFGVTYRLVERSFPDVPTEVLEGVQQERKLRGEAVSRSVSQRAVDQLLDPAEESDIVLNMLVKGTKQQSEDILYVYIRDKNGKVVAKTDTVDIKVKVPPDGLEPLGSKPVLAQVVNSEDGVSFYDVGVPVLVSTRKIGEAHTGILAPDVAAPAQVPILPKFILIGIAGIVGVLVITSLGVRSLRRVVPPEVSEAVGKLPELKEEEAQLSQKIAQKREEVFSLTKELEEKRKEEEQVSKRVDTKKKEEEQLPGQAKELEEKVGGLKEEVSKATEELAAVNQRVKAMKDEEEKVKEKLAAAASASKVKPTSPEKIESKKREELELIQRIVGKRREEIAITQRIEAKRKEGVDLARQIEALKKQIKSMKDERGG